MHGMECKYGMNGIVCAELNVCYGVCVWNEWNGIMEWNIWKWMYGMEWNVCMESQGTGNLKSSAFVSCSEFNLYETRYVIGSFSRVL